VLIPTLSGVQALLLTNGSDEQLAFVSPVERFIREQADVMIAVGAETNTKSLSGVDPARQAVFQRARAELTHAYMQRAATGELRWSSTLYPTDAYAQDADMATADFAEFVYQACKLDEPDPAAAWRAVHDEQARLIEWLADKREIHVVGPETDLTLSVGGRTWINSDGHRNFPSGEIFTGPIEDSANGVVRFSFPAVASGREIEDVRLRFEGGKVVEATAGKNEDYLRRMLDTDAGARFLGEFAFGTNFSITRFTKNVLLDEKIGGTVHMALGAGYPDSGSQNRSGIHWDLICDIRQGGRVDVDGQPFLRDGRYLI
jgi:aminopeptidase